MSSSLNKAILIGNLTRDPELKYIPSGQAVANFTVAVNRSWKSANGEKKEEVAFIRIVAWAKLAEVCNEYLKKGSQVAIEGRITTRSWEVDGEKRYATEVLAENVQFLGSKSGGSQDQGGNKKDPVKMSEHGPLAPDDEIPF